MATRGISGMTFKASLLGLIRNTADDGSYSEATLDFSVTDRFTTGIESSQANRGWKVKSYVLNTSGTLTIDLYDFVGMNIGSGSGNDMIGLPMSPIDEICAIVIRNENAVTSSGQLSIEPDATNGWAPIGTHTAATGGALYGQGTLIKTQMHTNGYAVTDASSHRIKFTAVGNTVTFSVWILARDDAEESSSSSSSSSTSSSTSSQSSSSVSSNSSSSSSSCSSASSTSSSSVSSSQSTSSMSTSSSSISTSSESSVSSSSQSSRSSSSSSQSTCSASSSCSSCSSSSPQSSPES